MQNKKICKAAEIMEWKDLRRSKDVYYLMFLSGENVAQYNLLTDFEINYTDPLVMPAGKEAGCRVAAVSPDYLPNRKIHQMFSIESFIQDSHRYFSLLSLMSRVAAPGYIKGTTTIN